MDLGLSGRRALVTGSSSGIGVAIAELLAQEGCRVVVHGRSKERAEAVADRLRQQGHEVAVVLGDLATDASAADVAARAGDAFGGLDVLVNNAGGGVEATDKGWFALSTQDWMTTYQANVLAAVRLVHAVVPDMRARGWGRLIHIGTAAALTPTSGQPDYGPAKAAMLNMSTGLSKALSGSGITSNTVSPGMIRTEGLERFLAALAQRRGLDDVAQAEAAVVKGTGQTVRRVGEPSDVAYAVAWLASPRADFVNGTDVHVDGGITPSLH